MHRRDYIDWNQTALIKRSERVDTPLLLLIEDAARRLEGVYSREQLVHLFAVPGQGGVTPLDRMHEMTVVREFWQADEGLLVMAIEYNAPWHSLLEPARHEGVDQAAVFEFVRDYLRHNPAWPTVDTMRRFIGAAPTRRLPGDVEGQGSLLGA